VLRAAGEPASVNRASDENRLIGAEPNDERRHLVWQAKSTHGNDLRNLRAAPSLNALMRSVRLGPVGRSSM